MTVFKLYRDTLWEQWYRDYYTIEAETLEEAIEIVKNDEEDPYDSEPIYIFEQDPLKTQIYNDDGDILYDSK